MVGVIQLDPPGVDEGIIMEEHFDIIEQPSPPSQGDFVSDTVNLPKARVGASTNDQRFLLVFILGTYFGPDLQDEVPRKSALQHAVMGLPSYSADQLGGSVFKLSKIESIVKTVTKHCRDKLTDSERTVQLEPGRPRGYIQCS